MNIHSILNFTKFLNKFRAIKRIVFTVGDGESENDSEHSYQLAMLAWYIISAEDLKLDKDLVIKYALVHDLVEVYAGDTYFCRSDKEEKDKKDREHKSLSRIKQEFPEIDDMYTFIQDYEKRLNRESRFVYALDKLLPVMNIYLDNGRDWRRHKVTLGNLIRFKTSKITLSPEVEPYFNELITILEENRGMFHEKHE